MASSARLLAQHRPHPDRGHSSPRVPRLRFDGGSRGASMTAARTRHGAHGAPTLQRLVSTARVADLATQAEAQQSDRHHRHLAHALGHARRAVAGRTRIRTSRGGEIAVVHNGIIENFEALRAALQAQGYAFGTQTDTEVIAHLVHAHWHGAGAAATCCAPCSWRSPSSRRVRDRRDLHARTGTRRRRPRRAARWWWASATDEHFLASDAAALRAGHAARRLPRGRRRRRRAPRVAARSTTRRDSASSATVVERAGGRRRGRARAVPPLHAEGDLRAAARGGRHARRRRRASTRRSSAPRPPRVLPRIDSVLILACGTSYYSGLVAKQWIETLAGMPCKVEIASEYRYRDSVPNPQRAGGRGVAVGRDRRHAGRAEAREVAGARAHARDLQRRHELDGAPDRARRSSRAPAPRSASRRPRRSRRSSSRCSCWR